MCFRSGLVVTPPLKIDGSHISLHWKKFQMPRHIQREAPSVDQVVSQLQSIISNPETCERFSWFSTVATVLKDKTENSTKEAHLGNSGAVLACIFYFYFISTAAYFLPTRKRSTTLSSCCLVMVEVHKSWFLKPLSPLTLVLDPESCYWSITCALSFRAMTTGLYTSVSFASSAQMNTCPAHLDFKLLLTDAKPNTK